MSLLIREKMFNITNFIRDMQIKTTMRDFPGGPVVKNLPANAGVMGSIPGLGRFHIPWGN